MREKPMLVSRVFGRFGLGLSAAVCAAGSVVAAATIWLLLTEPVRVATALDSKDLGVLAEAVLGLMASAVRALAGYL
jgi:hypothetical protein